MNAYTLTEMLFIFAYNSSEEFAVEFELIQNSVPVLLLIKTSTIVISYSHQYIRYYHIS